MSPAPCLVHVMGWRSQQYGSFERFLVALAARCTQLGANVHLVFQAQPASARFAEDVRAGLHVVPPARLPGDPLYAVRLARLLRAVGATHLHAHFGVDAYTALAVARALGIRRRFATKHITPGPHCRRHRWLARQVEVNFAVSRWVADHLRRCGVPEDRLEVVYIGVEPTAYHPDPAQRSRVRTELGIGDGTRIVLSTSHLRPGKGVEVLPELAAGLAADPDDVTVLVAGDGPLRPALAQIARRRGLAPDRFRLLGVRDDVPTLLAAADLFVFPTTGAEGMPLGVLEALATGVPVVASDVADNRLLADGAAVVPAGDYDALLSEARRLLTDPVAAAALVEHGRRLVAERFTLRAAIEAHVRLYFGER